MKNSCYAIVLLLLLSIQAKAQQVTLVIPSGHAGNIDGVAATSNGQYVASISYKTVMVWDMASRKKIHDISLNISLTSSETQSLCITDKLDKVLAATNSGLFCYNIQTGKELFKIGGSVSGAAFNKDGSRVYSINYGSLYTYDAATGNEVKLIADVVDKTGSDFKIFELEGNRLLLLYNYGWSIVNTETNEVAIKKVFADVYSEKMSGYDYSRKTNLIAGIRGENIIFFDPVKGNLLKTKKLSNKPDGLCMSESGDLVVFRQDYKAKLFKTEIINPTDLSIIKTASLPPSEVPESIFYGNYCLPLSGTGKIIYNNNNSLYAFDLQQGVISKLFQNKVADFKVFYAYTNLSDRLLKDNSLEFSTEDNGIRTLNMETLRPDTYIPASAYVVYSPDGKLAAGVDRKITITSRLTGKLVKTLLLPAGVDEKAERFFFNSDGTKLIYTEWEKGLLNAISISTGVVSKLMSFGSSFFGNATSFDGKYFACTIGAPVNYLKIYNLLTGQVVLNKKGCNPNKESNCFNGLAFLSDSYYLFTSRNGNQVTIYKADDVAYQSSFEQKDSRGVSVLGSDVKNDLIAISDDGGFGLKLINKEGKFIREFRPQKNSAFLKATFSKDDKLMFTPTSEKGVQVWNTGTGELLGTYYFIAKTNEYIFVSPEGLFDGSVEGMKELYFVKNNKPIPLEKLYERFYTPDLLRRKVAGEKFSPPDIANLNDAPTVSIAYAALQRNLTVGDDVPTYQNTTGAAEITVTANAADDAVDEIRLFQNGKIVNLVTRNLIVADDKTTIAVKKYTISLLPGQNNIRAIALNTQRTESDADEIVVNYNASANNSPVVTKPVNNNAAVISTINKDATLHLIVVGINEYQNKAMSLNYAMADATSFKEEVEKDAKTILGSIKTYFVTNNTADKMGIVNAFKQVQQNARAADVFIFYYAGHGVIGKDKEFYLVPTDVSDLKNVQTELEQKGIASKLLQQYAIDIQAQKQLFILDACQSAGAFEKLLSNDGDQQKSIALVSRSTGTHWMAASGALQYANEFSSLGHGVFTYVLLQALKGDAANNKMITVNGLKNFLQLQVPLLMKKYNGAAQYPASYGFGNDFPVELIK